MLRFDANQQTNRRQKQYVPQYRLEDIQIQLLKLLRSLRTGIVDKQMDRWKKESERHQSRIVSIYMLPFDRLNKMKTTPSPGSLQTDVLTKFHENWAKNVTSRVEICPPPGGYVFSSIWTIFELQCFDQNFMIIGQILKTAPPNGGHVFFNRPEPLFFELDQGITRKNLLTKFHTM
ncbi:hypothetical protein DPMN_062706 [Dreissena polymorpha]|uniref:Uncharacterized protein n=1 Tax=Dreissena polymorpha TaxID=45954 RepID=A0A9D4HID1_DREPO|nr:hypothetical protein DPMN_062706 [Dreissena polymorpha]